MLSDGRQVRVSALHPTADGRTMGDLAVKAMMDGARVVSVDQVLYDAAARYDLLPAGERGSYWANGILMNSTIEMTEKRPISATA
jgi:hypothetical protein